MKKQKCTSIQNYLEKCAKNNEKNPDNKYQDRKHDTKSIPG